MWKRFVNREKKVEIISPKEIRNDMDTYLNAGRLQVIKED